MCEYNSRYKKQIKFEVRNLNNVYNILSFQKNEGIEPSFFNFFLGINCKLLLYLIIKKNLSVKKCLSSYYNYWLCFLLALKMINL